MEDLTGHKIETRDDDNTDDLFNDGTKGTHINKSLKDHKKMIMLNLDNIWLTNDSGKKSLSLVAQSL